MAHEFCAMEAMGEGIFLRPGCWRSTPGEFDGGLDVGVEALVDRAGVGGADEFLLVLGAHGMRHVDIYGEAPDHARGGGGHLLFDGGGGAGDIDFEGAGHDAHHGEHAGAERGGHEVGGGELSPRPWLSLGASVLSSVAEGPCTALQCRSP